MLVEPGGELRQVVEYDVGAGLDQLLAGAATGQHGDADRAGCQRAFDVVHVVAHVDGCAFLAQDVGLPGAPHPAFEVVDVQAQVVDVELGVRRELAGDQDDPASVSTYGGQRVMRAGEHLDRRDRVVGIERPEPVPGRGDLGLRKVLDQQVIERRPELGRHLRQGEVDTQLGAQRAQGRSESGHGVDERHVEVETDDGSCWGHASNVEGGVRLTLNSHPAAIMDTRAGQLWRVE